MLTYEHVFIYDYFIRQKSNAESNIPKGTA